MRAAVYRGNGEIRIEEVPTPAIGAGELLVRVESCGICHTDLKKVEYDLLPPPRVYGHETAGVVVQAGEGVKNFSVGDRVIAFHHVPCLDCFYCRRKLYAQCEVYKRVGITAGFEPAGGGFSQYVRIMDWIVKRGVEKIPPGVSFERACFVEPVNTCHKAVVQADPKPDELVRTNSAIIAGFSNLPGRIAADSSALYAKNLVNLTPLLVSKEGAFAPQLDDEIVKGTLVAKGGQIVHPNLQTQAS